MTGLDRIAKAFAAAKAGDRAALMPYFTLGFPTPETSLDVIVALSAAGVDLLELGLPFSDPLADGPTIQRSTQVALENGVTLAHCLEMVAELRRRGVQTPFMLMGYYNPILNHGLESFVADAAAVGADGFILPDLPPEEAGEFEAACAAKGLALVYLLAPNSTPDRVSTVARRSTGFVYLVSLTGVTGARAVLPPDLQAFVQHVRAETDTPLAVGFGISTPEQAAAVGVLADGVIVGSALIDRVASANDDAPQAAAEFVASLRQGLEMQLEY